MDIKKVYQRPFHLYDPATKKRLRSRFYKNKRNAHMGALIEARWAKVGTTIEVLNMETGHSSGQYTRRLHTVAFTGGDHA